MKRSVNKLLRVGCGGDLFFCLFEKSFHFGPGKVKYDKKVRHYKKRLNTPQQKNIIKPIYFYDVAIDGKADTGDTRN